MEQPIVTRDQLGELTAVAMPELLPPPPRRWSDAEWTVICRGHQSQDMDDKWYAFVEADRLILHRSWTGRGIYEAQFIRNEGSWSITELLVCGDRSTYRRSSDEYEALFVEAIIDGVLVGNRDTDAMTRLRSMPGD